MDVLHLMMLNIQSILIDDNNFNDNVLVDFNDNRGYLENFNHLIESKQYLNNWWKGTYTVLRIDKFRCAVKKIFFYIFS